MNREGYSRSEKASDLYQTPKYFYKLLDNKFHFTLDPCTDKDNWLGTKKLYTIEDDGLKQDWQGERVFVNPPYSHAKEWSKKCFNEGQKPKTSVVLLIPVRSDTQYWHDYIMYAEEIWFCKGRINFLLNGVKQKSPNFPSCLVIFGKMYRNDDLDYYFPSPIIESFYHK